MHRYESTGKLQIMKMTIGHSVKFQPKRSANQNVSQSVNFAYFRWSLTFVRIEKSVSSKITKRRNLRISQNVYGKLFQWFFKIERAQRPMILDWHRKDHSNHDIAMLGSPETSRKLWQQLFKFHEDIIILTFFLQDLLQK